MESQAHLKWWLTHSSYDFGSRFRFSTWHRIFHKSIFWHPNGWGCGWQFVSWSWKLFHIAGKSLALDLYASIWYDCLRGIVYWFHTRKVCIETLSWPCDQIRVPPRLFYWEILDHNTGKWTKYNMTDVWEGRQKSRWWYYYLHCPHSSPYETWVCRCLETILYNCRMEKRNCPARHAFPSHDWSRPWKCNPNWSCCLGMQRQTDP